MRIKWYLALVSIFLAAQLSHARDLDSVKWAGYIIVSDEDEQERVTFDVKNLGDEETKDYKLTMIHDDQDYVFDQMELKDDQIIFKLDTGSLYDCKLVLMDDGSYTGDCITANTGSKSNKIIIMMAPEEADQTDQQTK